MSTIKEQIKVMQHFADGGKVEASDSVIGSRWIDCPFPAWNWLNCTYRIKKEPQVRYVVSWSDNGAHSKAESFFENKKEAESTVEILKRSPNRIRDVKLTKFVEEIQ